VDVIERFAHFIGVAPTAVVFAPSKGNDAAPQCVMHARTHTGQTVSVIANVELTPSAYFILERTIVEATQIFGPSRVEPAPVSVLHLGLDASWFPQEQWLMTTDGHRLLTTSVVWKGAGQSRKIALAESVTRPYLHTPRGKAAQALAKGYASG
jgi:hypothetical protein